jgi:hypothetical protein
MTEQHEYLKPENYFYTLKDKHNAMEIIVSNPQF